VKSGRSEQHAGSLKAELDTRFRAPLMAYFLRKTGNHNEAEDLTQETFVRLIRSESFEHADEANAYVFRVATNLLRDRARASTRASRYPTSPLEMVSSDDITRSLSEDCGPERVLIGRESLSEVLDALNELGDRTKSIFILFRLEGMKQKDIATVYGMGLSTVEKHVMSAVLHLAKCFGRASP
jgi:RNA polymerase sigma factor (sigma-70 family)